MSQRNTSTDWKGPSTRDMIASHTLAQNIIDHHNDPCPVFDDEQILILRAFVQDPSSAQELLQQEDMVDEEGDRVGGRALSKGSLAGYIMATYGTEETALTEEEVQKLKQWFDNGGGKTNEEV